MAKQIYVYGLFLLSVLSSKVDAAGSSSSSSSTSSSKGGVQFIAASCNATIYPTDCFNSLSGYANSVQTSPQRLAEAALNVTVREARLVKLFVTRLGLKTGLKKREVQAIKDCLEEMTETVYRLSRSVNEVKMCGKVKRFDQFWFHMSNALTWTSAALTYTDTCSDGFSGPIMEGRIKHLVQTRVVSLVRGTSNALALINAFAKKY